MDFNFNDMPAVPFAQDRPLVSATSEQLDAMTTTNSAYAIHKGDELVFDILNAEGSVAICIQPPYDDDSFPIVYIPCHRNGRKSWITGGNLTRRAKGGRVVSPFNEKMRVFATWRDLAEELTNKTVICVDVQIFQFNDWKTGQEINRPCPILKYKD